jgi:hypothetical protein
VKEGDGDIKAGNPKTKHESNSENKEKKRGEWIE